MSVEGASMKGMLLALIVGVLTVGCATAKPAPDEREKIKINCSGVMGSWDDCRESAGETCGKRGYDVVSVKSRSDTFRHMIIKCRQRYSPGPIRPGDAQPPQ